jgi:hypothetical protein
MLWRQKPLIENPKWLEPRNRGHYCLLRPFESYTFVPLVTEEMNALAELDITLLRPEAPGGLITQGGDMDNRLKTLFDSLTMPRHPNALPLVSVPGQEEMPFFCLLEDDNLVVDLALRTQQLLEPVTDTSLVDVTIVVRTRVTRQTMGNVVMW